MSTQLQVPVQTKKVKVGDTIKLQTLKGVATAKIGCLQPLNRVQIIECSLPSYNLVIFDDEDILEVLESSEDIVIEIDYKQKYEELLAKNKELQYQADLKDYAMSEIDLYRRENEALKKERNEFRSKAYDLECKVSEMNVELKFLKNLLKK